jgi:hypothetical protein
VRGILVADGIDGLSGGNRRPAGPSLHRKVATLSAIEGLSLGTREGRVLSRRTPEKLCVAKRSSQPEIQEQIQTSDLIN